MRTIDSFKGAYRFLSNSYSSPILLAGKEWPTVEHAFQASNCEDEGQRELIRAAPSPAKAKQLAGKLAPRLDWESDDERYMEVLVRCKFEQHPDLRRKLLATGDAELVEGNRRHDNTWGSCSCDRCRQVEGRNLLGKTLMAVRKDLRSEQASRSGAPDGATDEDRANRYTMHFNEGFDLTGDREGLQICATDYHAKDLKLTWRLVRTFMREALGETWAEEEEKPPEGKQADSDEAE